MLLFKIPIQLGVITLLIVYVVFNNNIDNQIWNAVFKTPILSPLLIYFLSLYTILAVSLSGNKLLNIENRVSSYLGEISYGIYMYHTTVIAVVILLMQKLPLQLGFITATLLL